MQINISKLKELDSTEIQANKSLWWSVIDLANNLGFDKLTQAQRVDKIISISHIINIRLKGENGNAIRSAENLERVLNGININHFAHADATNSALQFYSALTGDKELAKACNVCPTYDEGGTELRADAYAILMDSLNGSFGDTLFTRNQCKPVLMQTLYGSMTAWRKLLDPTGTVSTHRANQLDENGQLIWIETPKGVKPAVYPSTFDELHLEFMHEYIDTGIVFDALCQPVLDGAIVKDLQEYVMDALNDAFPIAMECMHLILSFHSPEYDHFDFTMPYSGFKVRSNVRTRTIDVVSMDLGFNSPVEVAITSNVIGKSEYSSALAPKHILGA